MTFENTKQQENVSEMQTDTTAMDATTEPDGEEKAPDTSAEATSVSDIETGLAKNGDEKSPDAKSEVAPGSEQDVEKTGEEPTEDTTNYVSGFKLLFIFSGLVLTTFLLALDNAILGTVYSTMIAIPTITTEFSSLQDVGWYGSAYMITVCALQPIAGKIYQQYSLKWAYLAFLAVFEIGSLVCATAPSSVALIIGRAVSGCGAAGIFSGGLLIVAHTIPLKHRPIYMGGLLAVFVFAAVVGPLVGGALTQHASWRWCFYINLPCGAFVFLLLVILFHPKSKELSKGGLLQKLKDLDLIGLALFAPAVIMLVLALQWGGSKYPWNTAPPIGLLCGFVGCTIAFALWQWHKGDEASMPPSIFLDRTVFFGSVAGLFTFSGIQVYAYYLPTWFQVINDVDPTTSGVYTLPQVLGSIAASVISGFLVTKLKYYNPFILFGTMLFIIAAGLFTTLKVDTPRPTVVGFQIISGVGSGTALQMPMVAIQSHLPLSKLPAGTSIMVVLQYLGAAVLLAIAQNIFSTTLTSEIRSRLPELDPAIIVHAGGSAARRIGGADSLPGILEAYNKAITTVSYLTLAGAIVGILCGLCLRWNKMKS